MPKDNTDHEHHIKKSDHERNEKGNTKENNSYSERNWGGLKEGYQPTKDVTSEPPTGGSGVPNKEHNE